MIIDHRDRWSTEDLLGLNTGTRVTNFQVSELPYFQMTLAQFPQLELQICTEAFDKLGRALSGNYYSLHAGKSVHDLSDFWQAFRENKAYSVDEDEVLNALEVSAQTA